MRDFAKELHDEFVINNPDRFEEFENEVAASGGLITEDHRDEIIGDYFVDYIRRHHGLRIPNSEVCRFYPNWLSWEESFDDDSQAPKYAFQLEERRQRKYEKRMSMIEGYFWTSEGYEKQIIRRTPSKDGDMHWRINARGRHLDWSISERLEFIKNSHQLDELPF